MVGGGGGDGVNLLFCYQWSYVTLDTSSPQPNDYHSHDKAREGRSMLNRDRQRSNKENQDTNKIDKRKVYYSVIFP